MQGARVEVGTRRKENDQRKDRSKRLARHPVETRKIGAQGGCEEGLPHEKGVIKLRGETTYSTEPWNVADLRIKGKKSEKDSVERKLKK